MSKISLKGSLPEWDLSDYYSGIHDSRVPRDLKRLVRGARRFQESYKGKLSKLSPKEFLCAIQACERISELASRLSQYSQLIFYSTSTPPEHGAFLQRVRKEVTLASQFITFFDLEISRFSREEFSALISDSILKKYTHYLQEVYKWKPYHLNEPEEVLLQEKNLTGSLAFVRFFDEELQGMCFSMRVGSKVYNLSRAQILDYLYHPDRELRKEAARVFSSGLKDNARRYTFIFNTLIEDKALSDRRRGFEYPDDSRHITNGISRDVVHVMTETVRQAYDVVQDFYVFKRRVLGVSRLYDYDRYAPISDAKTVFAFKDAREFIYKTFHDFSPRCAEFAEEFFEKKWIDAAAREGKYGSGFCMPGTPKIHPHLLINYNEGYLRNVMTLAHELGHGIHSRLKRNHSYFLYDTPLIFAETASVFMESLLFERLLNLFASKPRERFTLLIAHIEELIASVFRQTSLYFFEKDVHMLSRAKGELSMNDFNNCWRTRQEEMFRESVFVQPDYDVWWMYVSHFFHSPFYVYAYSFGELLTLSLFARYKKEDGAFVPHYLAFLEKVGTQSSEDVLRLLGVNPYSPDFWRNGIQLIREMIQEAKELHKRIRT